MSGMRWVLPIGIAKSGMLRIRIFCAAAMGG